MNFTDFELLCRKRHAVREFDATPIKKSILEKILRVVQTAPSGYNLQPVRFFVVTQQQIKEKLLPACMNQKTVLSASALVVFAVDRNAAEDSFERLYQEDLDRGVLTETKVSFSRKAVDMSFSKKPLGIGWITKACIVPLLRFFMPVPELPAVHKKSWTSFHGGMSSMLFILAAESEGLSTCPLGSFDEGRVKKILNIPHHFDVPIIVATGYSSHNPVTRAKLPFSEIVFWN